MKGNSIKTTVYIVLLVAEFAAGFVLLTLVSGGTLGWTYFLIVTAVWAALMALLLAKLKKTTDSDLKRKAKRNIALGMLIPLLGAVGGLVGYVLAFSAAGLV